MILLFNIINIKLIFIIQLLNMILILNIPIL
jgi:hypothetical protein